MRHTLLATLFTLACTPPSQRLTDNGAPPRDARPMTGTFEVNQTGAIIWYYAESTAPVKLVVHADPGPLGDPAASPPVVTAELQTRGETGYTAVAPIEGLQPATRYFYRVEAPGAEPGRWAQFSTAPPDDADVPVHFLVTADMQMQARYMSPVFDTMRGSPGSFAVSLGDWPYADSPWPGAVTVEAYRDRHRDTRLRTDVRRYLRRMPIFAIYDDHEVANDWDAKFQADEPARYAAAMQVWRAWFPVRQTAGEGLNYRRWRWGRHAEFFLLDARVYRSAKDAPDTAEKTVLGAAQKQWLFEGLKASTATYKIVFLSVPLAHGTTDEHFNAYTTERAELIAAFSTIPGLVIMTGDQHWFAAHRYGGLREYQFGPTQAVLRPPPPPEPGIVARVKSVNFGDIRIQPGEAGGPPTLTIAARNATGALVFHEVLTPETVNRVARPPEPKPEPPITAEPPPTEVPTTPAE